MNARERKVEVVLEGPAVEGRVSVDYLATLAKELQTTLRRIAQNRRTGPGRYTKEIEQACRLDLVSFKKSSARLGFELAGEPCDTLFGEIGEEAMKTLIDALDRSHTDQDHWALGLPESVIDGLDRITKPLEDGVTSFGLTTFGRAARSVTLRREFRNRLRAATVSDESPGAVQVTGVIWEADWKDHTAELYEPDGNLIRLRFDTDRDEDVTAARKCSVSVRGVGHYSEGRLRRIDLRHIEVLGPPAVEEAPGTFWSRPTVDELAERQAADVIEDIDDLAGDWPADEPLDDFLESLRSSRA